MKKVFTLLTAMTLSLMAHALGVTIDGIGEINGDTTITVTEIEEDPFQGSLMGVKGMLFHEATTMKVEITRSEAGLEDQICYGQCVNSNGQLTQTIDFPKAQVPGWYTHYVPVAGKAYTVAYKFIDGTNSLTLTIVYDATGFTALHDVQPVVKPGVYTILGERVRATSDTEGLHPGLYIINGKKVIIK